MRDEFFELFKEELRAQLEDVLKSNWEAEWAADFGPYDPERRNRRASFYTALAQKIADASEKTLTRDTIHRFVENTHNSTPYTLAAICRYLGYDSWEDFIEKNKETETLLPQDIDGLFNLKLPFSVNYRYLVGGGTLLALLYSALLFFGVSDYYNARSENVGFTLLKRAGKAAPSTFFFGVDLSNIDYDSAYVTFNHQPEALNFGNDQEKLRVKKAVDTLTYVSYKPDIIFAQLVIDGKVASIIRLFTRSEGWAGWYEAFLIESKTAWVDPLAHPAWYQQKGKLHYQRQNIQNAKHRGYYFTNFMNARDFDIDLRDANLQFNTRNTIQNGGISCFENCFRLYDDQGNLLEVNISRKGCMPFQSIHFNDKAIELTLDERENLTHDYFEWTTTEFRLKNDELVVLVDNQPLVSTQLPSEMNLLKAVKVSFKGSGEVNWVRMQDESGHHYAEDFGEVLTDKIGQTTYFP